MSVCQLVCQPTAVAWFHIYVILQLLKIGTEYGDQKLAINGKTDILLFALSQKLSQKVKFVTVASTTSGLYSHSRSISVWDRVFRATNLGQWGRGQKACEEKCNRTVKVPLYKRQLLKRWRSRSGLTFLQFLL